MSSPLPTVPWITFFVLEPISLLAGFLAAFLSPTSFARDQVPPTSPVFAPLAATIHSEVLTMQLGNLFLLMFLMVYGVIIHQKEAWAVRNYLIVLAIADVGHLYASVYGLGGWEGALDYASYNRMAWGNVAAVVVLFTMRVLTVGGVFGKLRDVEGKVKAA